MRRRPGRDSVDTRSRAASTPIEASGPLASERVK
jgi:hypothetical protein